MFKAKNQRLTVTSMLLAVGIILPFATAHGIGLQGNIILPMHIPVLLCGFFCGPVYGGLCGLILPVLNSVLTGMPSMYPMMPIMTFELLTYGAVSGLMYNKTGLGKLKFGAYPALIAAMVCGRAAYGIVYGVLLLLNPQMKALSVIGALTKGIPGIIIQLLFIPAIVEAVKRGFGSRKNAVASAINLINAGTATCVLIKGGTIIATADERGIAPVLHFYEKGLIKNAYVVDKIIGKASAMILVLAGAKGCYGKTMSTYARKFLSENGVKADCGEETEKIINRRGDGLCPMETAVLDIDDPKEGYEVLKRKIEQMREAKSDS